MTHIPGHVDYGTPGLKDWQVQFIQQEMETGTNLNQLLDSMGIPQSVEILGPANWFSPGSSYDLPLRHMGGGGQQGGQQVYNQGGGTQPPLENIGQFSGHGVTTHVGGPGAAIGGPGAATGQIINAPPTSVPSSVPPSGWPENYGQPPAGSDYRGQWAGDPNQVIGQETGGSPLGHVYVGSGTDPRTSPSASPSSGPPGPSGPVDPSADPRLWTSPMPGYIQFTPGGAIYEWNPSVDPAVLQAQQHKLTPIGGMEWARRFGTDPYVPGVNQMVMGGIVPDAGTNVYSNIAEWQRQAPGQWYGDTYYASPSEIEMQNLIRNENAMNALYARQMELARNQGYSFSGAPATGGYGGYGYSGPAYTPFGGWNAPQGGGTFASGVPAAPVGYPDIPAVPAGEPSFSPDPILDDASLDINTAGLEALSIPARTRLTQWLRDDLGFRPQGVLSSAGETSWQRPEGESGNIAFSAEDYAKITDPTLRSWIKWLMGKMGYSGASAYPLAAA